MEQPESSFPVIPLVSLAISFLVCKGEGKKSKIKKNVFHWLGSVGGQVLPKNQWPL